MIILRIATAWDFYSDASSLRLRTCINKAPINEIVRTAQ